MNEGLEDEDFKDISYRYITYRYVLSYLRGDLFFPKIKVSARYQKDRYYLYH